MSDAQHNNLEETFAGIMRRAGAPDAAIASFKLHLKRVAAGVTGTLDRTEIEPVTEITDMESLDPVVDAAALLRRAVVVKLNGGLGTGMGLEKAKSLVEARSGLSFLDLIARQLAALRRTSGQPIPLLLMNSFRTAADTEAALAAYPALTDQKLPLGFLQHRVPKITADALTPVVWPADPELEWCPPGHGDLYTALATSGLLNRLLDAGIEVAFVSNSDNLGATLDPTLLAHMLESGTDFMMEVADRTPADRKGGHLCRRRNGRLALRDLAQCPPDELDEFQDVERYRFFNTNNLWISLPALAELLDRHRGVLPLDTIVNRKRVDPRDPESPAVIQLETAMGAAVSLFDRAAAIRVPRSRFSPVKSTDDLLAIRSDAYQLTDDGRVVLAEGRTAPPSISLDSRYYRRIDDFDRRFPTGPPSLAACRRLVVDGDVSFGAGVIIEGDVHIRASNGPVRIPDKAVLRGEHRA